VRLPREVSGEDLSTRLASYRLDRDALLVLLSF